MHGVEFLRLQAAVFEIAILLCRSPHANDGKRPENRKAGSTAHSGLPGIRRSTDAVFLGISLTSWWLVGVETHSGGAVERANGDQQQRRDELVACAMTGKRVTAIADIMQRNPSETCSKGQLSKSLEIYFAGTVSRLALRRRLVRKRKSERCPHA